MGVSGDLPHVCGSFYAPDDECWRYQPTSDEWKRTSRIGRVVDRAASAYHEDWGIIMSGGAVGYDEVTLTTNGEDFTDLPTPVPEEDYYYCVAAIDANRIFITGLGDDQDNTYMYDKATDQWDDTLPKMPTGRAGMGCGVVTNEDNEMSVVVFGGSYDGFVYLDTVEIYSVGDKSWKTGKLLKRFPNSTL